MSQKKPGKRRRRGMRASRTDELGDIGQKAASAELTRKGFGPVENLTHDLGTDLFVQLRDAEGYDLGLLLGVQVKAGPYFFRRRKTIDGESGWWFKTDASHANYWRSHFLRHLVVLVDVDEDREVLGMYWAPLSGETLISTGKRFKVFVPETNLLRDTASDDLVALAKDRRRELSYAGQAWSFRAGSLAEEDRARFALMVPRLVAPHPNRRYSIEVLEWHEAAALALQADAAAWTRVSEESSDVPSIEDARSHADATWRFAALVHDWGCGLPVGDAYIESLKADPVLRTPATLIQALRRFEQDPRGAVAVMKHMDSQDVTAEDLAWHHLLLGRLLLEIADWDEAADVFEQAEALLAQVPSDDLTIDYLRAQVLGATFEFADEGAFGRLIMAVDNQINWWRSRELASALETAIEDAYQGEFGRGGFRFGGENAAHNKLACIGLVAQLSGAWDQWRNAQGLNARRAVLLSGNTYENPLTQFRQAGKKDALGAAINRLVDEGPLVTLQDFARHLTVSSTTTSTLQCDLLAVRQLHWLLPTHLAKLWVDALVGSVTGLAPLPEPRNAFVTGDVLRTLAAVAEFISDDDRLAVARALLERDDLQHSLAADPALELAPKLGLSGQCRSELAGIVSGDALTEHRERLLMALFPGSAASEEAAKDLLAQGDLNALLAFSYWADLTSEQLIAIGAAAVQLQHRLRIKRSARTRSMPFGAPDPGELIAQVALHSDDDSDAWTKLVELMADPDLHPAHKDGAAAKLVRRSTEIPHHIREPLREATTYGMSQLDMLEFRPGLGLTTNPGHFAALLLALTKGDDFQPLLADSLNDPATRSMCITALGSKPGTELLLVGLLGDRDPSVRLEAGQALMRLLLSSENADQHYVDALVGHLKESGPAALWKVLNVINEGDYARSRVPPAILAVLEGCGISGVIGWISALP